MTHQFIGLVHQTGVMSVKPMRKAFGKAAQSPMPSRNKRMRAAENNTGEAVEKSWMSFCRLRTVKASSGVRVARNKGF